ncbi:hypothetical protein LTR78_004109 [Recurvomyces mirabilis]|uniref:Chitin-binding type-4 domain-containing protein n=1 Tax=Recurvomyces mirabilis TaxID=574656 RepID=A0AAE0WQ43_9PEZI|nr:hypothetical protein LTR78_004109 [Recurvomyces mirabilis]KAK5153719.1 hypothetical protein LTS14_007413 [Recurvomyces mirabilis]
MQLIHSLLAAASLATLANAHGYFVTPKARQPGTAFQQSCGMQAFYQMSGDINGNVQGLQQTTKGQSDYNPSTCRLWKCKGMKYADNTANVQKYTPGQSVAMNFAIRAPHTGVANVSIIDITTPDGTVIAPNLKSWSVYASNSASIPDGEENFSITMPTNLGSKCAQAGQCAIQMFWDARSIDQTYESCIDFSMPAKAGKREEERGHARDFTVRDEIEG